METNGKNRLTWALFGGAGALVLAGLILQLTRLSPTPPPAPKVEPPTVVVNLPPPVVVEPAPVPEPPVPPIPVVVAPVAIPQPPTPPPPPSKPRIDVVFVLDTTSSMTGLLEGAKQKIWSIASRIASGKPTPELRVGLVAYRDRGDDYVTRVFPLTRNLDEVYAQLRGFKAEGGGDPPEDVRQALVDAVRKMRWGEGSNVLRLVFLVGDSPPQEYADEPSEQAIGAEARRRGIAINTIRCGDLETTASSWQMIARAGRGQFTSIAQDGGMQAVATPMDARLVELNARLATTTVTYGDDKDRRAADKRIESNARMEAASQAESAYYRSVTGYMDSNDLVGAAAAGRVKVEDVPAAALPAPMQAMKPAERRAFVEGKKAERERISKEVLELSQKRDSYLKAKAPAASQAFDSEVQEMVEKQAGSVGVSY